MLHRDKLVARIGLRNACLGAKKIFYEALYTIYTVALTMNINCLEIKIVGEIMLQTRPYVAATIRQRSRHLEKIQQMDREQMARTECISKRSGGKLMP